MTQEELEAHEQGLTRALSAWAAASIAIGGYATRAGRRVGNADLAAFGRQTAAWGAIDVVIAAAGTLSRARRGNLDDEGVARQAERLRRLLLVNAGADIAYVLGGLVIAGRGRGDRTTVRLRRGDGVAIAVQGAFLLALDTAYARRLGRTA